eukprot:5900437-Pyramimonas_sp.AAC.1
MSGSWRSGKDLPKKDICGELATDNLLNVYAHTDLVDGWAPGCNIPLHMFTVTIYLYTLVMSWIGLIGITQMMNGRFLMAMHMSRSNGTKIDECMRPEGHTIDIFV